MEKILEQFKQIAPHYMVKVKARLTGIESDAETLAIIQEEITAYFDGWQKFFAQYMTFNDGQRREFAGFMYGLVKPLAKDHPATINPVYAQFVIETGNTGALNFITHHLSKATHH